MEFNFINNSSASPFQGSSFLPSDNAYLHVYDDFFFVSGWTTRLATTIAIASAQMMKMMRRLSAFCITGCGSVYVCEGSPTVKMENNDQ